NPCLRIALKRCRGWTTCRCATILPSRCSICTNAAPASRCWSRSRPMLPGAMTICSNAARSKRKSCCRWYATRAPISSSARHCRKRPKRRYLSARRLTGEDSRRYAVRTFDFSGISMAHRVQFDFDIEFSNGGGLSGRDFRLDIPGDDIADAELADYLVADLRLLMVGGVRIGNKRIIIEAHKRAAEELFIDLSHTIEHGTLTHR